MRQLAITANATLSATALQLVSHSVQCYCPREELFVDRQLAEFVEHKMLADDRSEALQFWDNLVTLIEEFGPAHRGLQSSAMGTTATVLDEAGVAIPEQILQALMAATLGHTDIRQNRDNPQEHDFCCRLYDRAERLTALLH